MAYMPNYGYPQYGYQNQFNQNQFGQNQFTQSLPVSQPTMMSQPQLPTLYGKVVDGYNTADSQDVPIGMSGIYPKADGNAVFIKKWLDNGTTKTYEYKLVEQNLEETAILPTINFEEKFNETYKLIDELSKKIDKLSPAPLPKKKKVLEEVDEDDE